MIRRFLLLNGMAAFAAVLYHATGRSFIAMFWWTDRFAEVTVPNFDLLGGPAYFALRVIEQLVIFAVPAFLVVSGFFIAFATGRERSNIDLNTVKNRVRSLLIPYLLWSILILFARYLQGDKYTPLAYIQVLLQGRAAPPYYFVPLLIQLYILSPLLVPLARKHKHMLLFLSLIIQLFVRTLIYLDTLSMLPTLLQPMMSVTASWLFPGHLFWFSAGIVIGFNLEQFKASLERVKWYLVALLVTLFPLGILEWELILNASPMAWIAPRETIIDSIYALTFILTFMAFTDLTIPFSREFSDWGSKSFGIYLAHQPILEYSSRAIYNLVPFILGHQILFYSLIVFLGMALPLLAMKLVNMRWSPIRPYYQYIFG